MFRPALVFKEWLRIRNNIVIVRCLDHDDAPCRKDVFDLLGCLDAIKILLGNIQRNFFRIG